MIYTIGHYVCAKFIVCDSNIEGVVHEGLHRDEVQQSPHRASRHIWPHLLCLVILKKKVKRKSHPISALDIEGTENLITCTCPTL